MGNQAAFEALVARYQSRLLAFCRHMLSSKEDAEDVLQEVFAAAFNAMLADDRPINVRPWLYRIARNRSLNHLRRTQAVGVDSMDVHLSEGGTTTADKVHKREEFRLLVSDVQDLPETQRTALLLREIDALSYEQIADAMETTVPSVKSLLVRARVSLAEAAEARLLTCEEVRDELGEVAEGLRRTSAPVRRHLRTCDRCTAFRKQLRETNKALAAVFPVAPLLLLKKTLLAHLGTTAAASGGTAAAAGGGDGRRGRRRRRRAAGGRERAGHARPPPASPPPRSSPPAPSRPSTSRSTAPKPSQAVAAAATPAARRQRRALRAGRHQLRAAADGQQARPPRARGRRKADSKPAAKKPAAPKKPAVKDGTLVAAVDPAARAARGRHRGADRRHRLDRSPAAARCRPARRRRRPSPRRRPAAAARRSRSPDPDRHPRRPRRSRRSRRRRARSPTPGRRSPTPTPPPRQWIRAPTGTSASGSQQDDPAALVRRAERRAPRT